MAEHDDAPEDEVEAGPEAASPAAVAIALSKTSKNNKAVDAEAAAFLRDQRALIGDQRHHLAAQYKHLTLKYWSERLKLALQGLTVLMGVGVFAIVAALMIDAANDRSLVVEAFHTPPDFAARGEDGQVLAGEVMDRLAAIDAASQSLRASSTYTNAWKGEAKVELPETGVSIGELRRFLSDWLGHETRITGEAVRTPRGIRLTVRAGGSPGFSVEGPEADLDKLVQQSAEHIYGQTQPYQFSKWLEYHGRPDEALKVARNLALNGTPEEQVWAEAAVCDLLTFVGDSKGAARACNRALALNPDSTVSATNLAPAEILAGHDGAALAAQKLTVRLLRAGAPEIAARMLRSTQTGNEAALAGMLGDYRASASYDVQQAALPDFQGFQLIAQIAQADAVARNHDASGARRLRAALPNPEVDLAYFAHDVETAGDIAPQYFEAAEVGDWLAAAAFARRAIEASRALGRLGEDLRNVSFIPRLAYAMARTGDIAGARATIAPTAMDCDFCVRARGRIESLAHNWAGADYDFAVVARRSANTPFVWEDWGRSLLLRGDAKGAAAKAEIALDRGPHFADANELWGEALLAQGDAEGAVEKFEAAAKDAPRWGHNRVMWAAALQKAGDANGAHRQRIYARGMDLTTADRAMVEPPPGGGAHG
jgi:tetratricopeptide (TPR) repeat protein